MVLAEIGFVGRDLAVETPAPVAVDLEQAVAFKMATQLVVFHDRPIVVADAVLIGARQFEAKAAVPHALPVFDIADGAGRIWVPTDAHDGRNGHVLVRPQGHKVRLGILCAGST